MISRIQGWPLRTCRRVKRLNTNAIMLMNPSVGLEVIGDVLTRRDFMGIFLVDRTTLDKLQRTLRVIYPQMRPSHLGEAIATGLHWRTRAAMLDTIKLGAYPAAFSFEAFSDRLSSLSHMSVEKHSAVEHALRSCLAVASTADITFHRLLDSAEGGDGDINYGGGFLLIERADCLCRLDADMGSGESVDALARRLAHESGTRSQESIFDFYHPRGFHLSYISDSVAQNGGTFSLRRPLRPRSAHDLIESGFLTGDALEFLYENIVCGRRIAVIGGRRSGVTTLLHALSTVRGPIPLEVFSCQTRHNPVTNPHPRGACVIEPARGHVSMARVIEMSDRAGAERGLLLAEWEPRGDAGTVLVRRALRGHAMLCGFFGHNIGEWFKRLTDEVGKTSLPHENAEDMVEHAWDVVVQLVRFSDGRRRVVKITMNDSQSQGEFEDAFTWTEDKGLHRPAR